MEYIYIPAKWIHNYTLDLLCSKIKIPFVSDWTFISFLSIISNPLFRYCIFKNPFFPYINIYYNYNEYINIIIYFTLTIWVIFFARDKCDNSKLHFASNSRNELSTFYLLYIPTLLVRWFSMSGFPIWTCCILIRKEEKIIFLIL